MLGKLARWLRFLGHDVAYVKDLGDSGILAAARAEGRFLLTRDVELAERAARDPGSLLLRAMDPRAQLQEVVQALGLAADREQFLSRCSVCNTILEPASEEDLARVPEGVLRGRTLDAFWACRGCARVYWEGTHARRIADALERVGGD